MLCSPVTVRLESKHGSIAFFLAAHFPSKEIFTILKGQDSAMTGPEHSKKSKSVTIDLEPEAIHEVKAQDVSEPVIETPEVPEEKPFDQPEQPLHETNTSVAAPQSSGLMGKLGAGVIGGLIALTGGAGLQYGGLLPSFGSGAELGALQAQVDKLSAAPVFDPASIETISRAQGDIATQVSALGSELAQLKTATPGSNNEAVGALEAKLAALEGTIANLGSSGTADPASSAAFKALADKVAALEAKPADAGDAKSVATAIAASGLKAAIDRGGSFMNELETYASVAPASPDVEALRALAAKGVPSQQELLAQFGDAANAMIAAAVVPDPEMGILQRLTESAKGLVKARRVGDVQGDEPDAVVARMEVALQRGDLASVLTQSEKLPEASKVAGKDFLDKITARRDTDTLVTRALGLALAQAGGKS
ncbi:MAG: hypothetical protein ACRCU5_07685 [Rhizobiaceae bacterium]